MPPTIVLVHGAFAESSNWDAVIDLLLDGGHPVIAAANPLRGIANDAAAVTDVVRAVDGPIVLAAHSYGGAVISNVPADAGEIVGLVYIDAFAPDAGESCFALAGKFPAACSARRRSVRSRTTDGTTDLFIIQDRFHEVFCADLPAPQAGRMVVTQRPGTREGPRRAFRPLWKQVPSWFLVGDGDRVIPPALQRYMAERAEAHQMPEIPRASHASAVSHPGETAGLILEAAASRVAA
jgi:pimeloyl-ACP methyl ester carboxylesterase